MLSLLMMYIVLLREWTPISVTISLINNHFPCLFNFVFIDVTVSFSEKSETQKVVTSTSSVKDNNATLPLPPISSLPGMSIHTLLACDYLT